MTPYQQFIAKSRYSRYIDAEQRREDWSETVERYFTFMKGKVTLPDEVWKRCQWYVENLKVMPSMRVLMTAGPALERDNTAGYNCAYLPIDDPKSFDESMYILLCGTGVGYSVEDQYVSKLPEVPEKLFNSKTCIAVHDSKEGWAKSLRQLLALLWSGEIPVWDVSKVRPAGARLKVFGGRASGPEPLEDLFKFCINTFKKAQGRKLNSLECHDILCKIGEVVVSGGVRRSAMISLSDLDDDQLRHCKDGQWYVSNVQRALSNNSAVYTSKPDIGTFLREWEALYSSKSGERGIFNRAAATKIAARNGRRDIKHIFGTNPCSEIILRPYQFCNLTEIVVEADDDERSLRDKVEVATILGTVQASLTKFPYLRKVWVKNCEEERLLGVSMTGILDNKWLIGCAPAVLQGLRDHAIDINRHYASVIGINPATAITCVKPSGTVSQLCDTASGIHPRHSAYYLRRVRCDNKDPLTAFLIAKGLPYEPDVTKPDVTTVFTFPVKAPEGAMLREHLPAVGHLMLWKKFQDYWCEHKPSVTISVLEEEWIDVAAYVYHNFDSMSGVSFLPYDGGSYRQAPYEEVSEEEYLKALDKMPLDIKWEDLIESTDNVEGAQTLACVAGYCEI